MNATAQVCATHGSVHIPEPGDPCELAPAVFGKLSCAKPWLDDERMESDNHLDYP